MRRKRMPRKEGSPLTNNHSRSITTDDSSVAEDGTLYARHARREPVNHRTLVSCRGGAEAPETEFHKAHEAWWSGGRFESSGMHQTMRAITMHSSRPSALSPVTPVASRQYPANVPSHLPILSHFCVCLCRPPVRPTRTHNGLAFGGPMITFISCRGITIVTAVRGENGE